MARLGRRALLASTGWTAGGLFLGACSSSSNSGKSSTAGTTGASTSPASGSAATAAAASAGTSRSATPSGSPQAAVPAGKITVGVDTLLEESLDIARWVGGNQLHQMLLVNDTLVRRDADSKFIPALATSWTSDSTGWQFQLNPAARFHNGDPVTATDVVFMVNRLLAPESKSFLLGDLKPVLKSVEAPDPHTVRFNTNVPYPLMLAVAWSIAPQSKAYFDKVGEEAALANYVGSGPFKMTDHVQGQSMTFEAMPDFYDASRVPRIKTVTLRVIPDNGTRFSSLQANELDVAILGFPQAQKLGPQDSIKIVQSKAASGRLFVVHDLVLPDNSPLKDLRVRQALLMAFDRKALISTLFGGFGDPMITFDFPSTLGYDPSLTAVPFDPKQAKQLLTAAGYGNGFDLTMHTNGSGTTPGDEFPAIASYLQQVGVRVTIQQQETVAYVNDLRDRKLHGIGDIGGTAAVSGIDGVKLWNSFVRCGAQYSNACIPDSDTIADKAQTELDATARLQELRQLNKEMYDQLPLLPRYYLSSLFGIGPRVTHLQFPTGWVYVGGLPLETATVKG